MHWKDSLVIAPAALRTSRVPALFANHDFDWLSGLSLSIVADNAMSYNRATDFYSGVSRVLAAKPDAMFIGGPSEPAGLVAQQARELGFKGGFIVMDQAKLDEVAKATNGYAPLNGAIGVLPLADDSTPCAHRVRSRSCAARRAQFTAPRRRCSHRYLHRQPRHAPRPLPAACATESCRCPTSATTRRIRRSAVPCTRPSAHAPSR